MTYVFSTNNDTIKRFKEFLPIQIGEVKFFEYEEDIFDVEYKESDILVISLDSLQTSINEFITYLKESDIRVNVIALRNIPKVQEGSVLLKSGIKSYLNTYASPVIFSQAFEVVSRGEIFAYPELMSYLISLVGTVVVDDSKLLDLSPRELEIAHFVAEGKSNAEIAHLLELAEITVKKHLTSIFHKLGIRDRIGLALFIK